MKRENKYQSELKRRIEREFPNCIILKNDPDYIQGIPDLLVLNNDKWCALEVKKSANEKPRPNQPEYVKKLDDMSMASFIFPENEAQVISKMKEHFKEV